MVVINFMGLIYVIEILVLLMVVVGWGGYLVNVFLVVGLVGLLWYVVYSVSKYGLWGFFEVLCFDLVWYGIGVLVVVFGVVKILLVNMVEIVGVDCDDLRVNCWVEWFSGYVVMLEKVVDKILVGVIRNRYLVYMLVDIWVLYVFK